MVIVIQFFLGISDQGGRVHEDNPMWSTNWWNKARPQHQEFHPLLFSLLFALTCEILFLPREHKIHIFELKSNVIFII